MFKSSFPSCAHLKDPFEQRSFRCPCCGKLEKIPDECIGETIRYQCRNCLQYEEIPIGVVESFHLLDPGDPTVPPRFSCDHCGGEMWPEQDWDSLRRRIDDSDDFEGNWEDGHDFPSRTDDTFLIDKDIPFQ